MIKSPTNPAGVRERIFRAKGYCEGYDAGLYLGRKNWATEADAECSPSHRAGFARGVVAANRARSGESAAEQDAAEIIADAIRRLEPDLYKGFTEEQSKEWRSLQALIKRNVKNGTKTVSSDSTVT